MRVNINRLRCSIIRMVIQLPSSGKTEFLIFVILEMRVVSILCLHGKKYRFERGYSCIDGVGLYLVDSGVSPTTVAVTKRTKGNSHIFSYRMSYDFYHL